MTTFLLHQTSLTLCFISSTSTTVSRNALQPGRDQVASGYCLFSHATLLVLTMGKGTGTHMFTLDPAIGDFILTKKSMIVPKRGKKAISDDDDDDDDDDDAVDGQTEDWLTDSLMLVYLFM